MKDDIKQKQSKTITFRLDSDLLDELKNETKIEKVNLNLLVSKILSNHILWEKYERKLGLLPMTKPFVKAALDGMTEKQISELATKVEKETLSDILNFMKGEYNVEDFVEILRTWLNVAWMQHDFDRTKNSYVFKIQHDLGEKWSLYVRTLVIGLFHDIMKQELTVNSSKTTIKFTFPIQ